MVDIFYNLRFGKIQCLFFRLIIGSGFFLIDFLDLIGIVGCGIVDKFFGDFILGFDFSHLFLGIGVNAAYGGYGVATLVEVDDAHALCGREN